MKAPASIMALATPRLLLRDSKAPNCRKNKVLKDFGPYAEWPKVADTVIKAKAPAWMSLSCGREIGSDMERRFSSISYVFALLQTPIN